ncbi:hypothetical protein [Sphingomonas humi]|uniref:hypothetical protein n=1 Tax=Sphingomonas humi TaxID=335630 RepID=UPI0031D6BC2F
MELLAPAYISTLASQIGSLSAFLGGFAATFLATLLTIKREGHLLTVTITLAVVAAVAFIISVIASTVQIAIYHPNAPSFVSDFPRARIQMSMLLGFMVGTLALLGSLGCCGWLRSRQIGWITAAVGFFGAMMVIVLTVYN